MILDIHDDEAFHLEPSFLEPYRQRPVPWGFGPLSRVTYKRTYSRGGESWWQTCRRVIEGMFTIQRHHCRRCGLPWDRARARAYAEDAYDRLWSFKWTPPGRGLWIMGTRFVVEHGGAALNNCGFVSTAGLNDDYAAPFEWMFRMSMVGVGVGFDTRGRHSLRLRKPAVASEPHVIGDSREGWADALRRLLSAYAGNGELPSRWDFSRVRPRGAPLHSFGGTASGPEPLRRMLHDLAGLHDAYVGQLVDSRLIVDTMNLVGRCVVSGGVRRSAQIAFGAPDDTAFLDLKQDERKVNEFRWVSNNSVFADVGMDYGEIAARTVKNGEPGFLWLENARRFGRMLDPPDDLDRAAMGSNPCVEQTLWDRELCCLVETYPARHETFSDYCRTLRVAYQYAKTVTLVPTEDPHTNAVLLRNRRIGCSMTGIVQAVNRLGYRSFFRWCDQAYAFVQKLDKEYSDWLCIPRSIKTTSVKPSGTVSLLAGATPGVHWEHSPYYLRRIRVADNHALVKMCREAGYPVEPDAYSAHTAVISFPIHVKHLGRRKADVPVREKVDLAAQMQRYWSDNQVSCTVEFDARRERDEIRRILPAYEDRLKAIVFLPSEEHGYHQPPYEEISPEAYRNLMEKIRPLRGDVEHEVDQEERFCEGTACDANGT